MMDGAEVMLSRVGIDRQGGSCVEREEGREIGRGRATRSDGGEGKEGEELQEEEMEERGGRDAKLAFHLSSCPDTIFGRAN